MSELFLILAQVGISILNAIFTKGPDDQLNEGARLGQTEITTATWGTPKPVCFGTAAPLNGNIVSVGDVEEEVIEDKEEFTTGGFFGLFGNTFEVVNRTFLYYQSARINFAEVEGPSPRAANGRRATLLKLWLNNELHYDKTGGEGTNLATEGFSFVWFDGAEDQDVWDVEEAYVSARTGFADSATAYRGECGIGLERLPLDPYGRRLPQVRATINFVGPDPQVPKTTFSPPVQTQSSNEDIAVDWLRRIVYVREGGSTVISKVGMDENALLGQITGLAIEAVNSASHFVVDVEGFIYYFRTEARGTPSVNYSVVDKLDPVTGSIVATSVHERTGSPNGRAIVPCQSQLNNPLQEYVIFVSGGSGGQEVVTHFRNQPTSGGLPVGKDDPPGEPCGGRAGFGDLAFPLNWTTCCPPMPTLDTLSGIVKSGVFRSNGGFTNGTQVETVFFAGPIVGTGNLRIERHTVQFLSGFEPPLCPTAGEIKGSWRQSKGETDLTNTIADATVAGPWVAYLAAEDAAFTVFSNGNVVKWNISTGAELARLTPAQIGATPSEVRSKVSLSNYKGSGLIALITGSGDEMVLIDPTGDMAVAFKPGTTDAALYVDTDFNLPSASELVDLVYDETSHSVFFWENTGGSNYVRVFLDRANGIDADLADVVSALCERGSVNDLAGPGLRTQHPSPAATDQIDVSALVGNVVKGFKWNQQGAATQAIAALAFYYPELSGFGVVESDFEIKFVVYGANSVRTLTEEEDLGAGARAAQPEPVSETILAEREFPRRVTVKYRDLAIDGEVSLQVDDRFTNPVASMGSLEDKQQDYTGGVSIMSEADSGKTVANRALTRAWEESQAMGWSQTMRHLALDPLDIITLIAKGETFVVRIDEIETGANLTQNCKGLTDEAAAYALDSGVGVPVGDGYVPSGIPTRSVVDFLVLDIAVAKATDGVPGVYVLFLSTDANLVASLLVSRDGGVFSTFVGSNGRPTWGRAATVLGDHSPIGTWDDTNTVDIQLADATMTLPQAADDDALLLNGENFIRIGQEWLQYRDRSDLGGGLFRISRLLRGLRCSEGAVGAHSGSELVVLHNEALVRGFFTLEDVGQTFFFRSQAVRSTPGPIQSLLYAGNDIRPCAPSNIQAHRAPFHNDVVLTWVPAAFDPEDVLDAGSGMGISGTFEVDLLTPSGAVHKTYSVENTPVDTQVDRFKVLVTSIDADQAGTTHVSGATKDGDFENATPPALPPSWSAESGTRQGTDTSVSVDGGTLNAYEGSNFLASNRVSGGEDSGENVTIQKIDLDADAANATEYRDDISRGVARLVTTWRQASFDTLKDAGGVELRFYLGDPDAGGVLTKTTRSANVAAGNAWTLRTFEAMIPTGIAGDPWVVVAVRGKQSSGTLSIEAFFDDVQLSMEDNELAALSQLTAPDDLLSVPDGHLVDYVDQTNASNSGRFEVVRKYKTVNGADFDVNVVVYHPNAIHDNTIGQPDDEMSYDVNQTRLPEADLIAAGYEPGDAVSVVVYEVNQGTGLRGGGGSATV